MIINISYLNTPLEGDDLKLNENMWITAKPYYKNKNIKFEQLHRMVSSNYRQYSPFFFKDGTKKSENWNNENQNILILDIDDGLTIDKAKEIFKCFKYFICTTKSHQKEKKGLVCDRFRIILPIINNPIGDDYFSYMRNLEKMFSFIDVQVNTKTGAFLGFAKCEYWYNNGDLFDMDILRPVSIKKVEKIINKQMPFNEADIALESIKSSLTRETVAEIVNSLGFEVDRNFKFKYRQDERTPSASINNATNPLIKDFGSDISGDIFYFVQKVNNLNFLESVDYVKRYI